MDQLTKDASYSVGMSVGQSLMGQGLDQIDLALFAEGIQSVFNDDSKFTPEQVNQNIGDYLDKVMESKFQKNKDASEAFLTENAKKDGVVTLPSGLQYEIVEAGTGPMPNPSSQVTVHYHGTLTSGEVFDSSVERGEPATFGVGQVIKGWTEALQLMAEGSKWKLFIPQDLAYGASPRPGGPIEPFMALIFDVELIKIN